MRYLTEAIAWLTDPMHWPGPGGLGVLTTQHIAYSLLGLAVSALIALPLGWWIGHSGHGRGMAVALTGATRALPTLGLITLFGLVLGIGLGAPLVAFVVLGVPSILAGAYTGVESADRQAVDGARASGMTEWQILTRVEIPLGARLLVGGLRSASLQIIATATLAAYTGAGGLGSLLFLGLKTQNYVMMLATCLAVVILAMASEALFAMVQRVVTPAGSSIRRKDTP